MKKWEVFSNKKSLWVFLFLGAAFAFSVGLQKSEAATSSEYNFFNTSPAGSSGGFAVPASCPSDLHDAAWYGQSCTSATNACGQSATGTLDCSGSCTATPPALPANYGQSCSASNNCGVTNSGSIGCTNNCSAVAPLDEPVGSACQSPPNSVGQRNNGVWSCNGCGGGIGCTACAPPDPPACGAQTSGGWCNSDHSYSWICKDPSPSCNSSPGAGWVDVGGGCWNKDNGFTGACQVCGNGVIGLGEPCDNGAGNVLSCTSAGQCLKTLNTCSVCGGGGGGGGGPTCGDGIPGNIAGEQCDLGSGNGTCPSTCSSTCQNQTCTATDGACGGLNGAFLPGSPAGAPAWQLCNPGTPWGMSGPVGGPWHWNCDGIGGGNPAPGGCWAFPMVCGDGVIGGTEQCDNGAANGPPPAACSAACTINPGPVCGNAVVEAGEGCDQGAANGICGSGASCSPICQPCGGPVCGNGVKEGTEACDNGAGNVAACAAPGQCLKNSCTICAAVCGNGVKEGTEACDLGAGNGLCPSACSATCTNNSCGVCGDGVINSGEPCDNGAGNVASCTVNGQCLQSAGVCSVCVIPPPPNILYICPSSATVAVGAPATPLRAYFSPVVSCVAPVNQVTQNVLTSWLSLNPGTATVTNAGIKGLVSGIAGGSTFVRATYSGNTANALINVTCLPISNCNPAQVANMCQGTSYTTTNSCGATEVCLGTRTCDFNWKEIAP